MSIAASFFSWSTIHDAEEEPNYEDMTDRALKDFLELSIRTNRILTLENEIFENYLFQHDPQSLIPMAQILEAAKYITAKMRERSASRFHLSDSKFTLDALKDKTSLSSSISLHTFTDIRSFTPSIMLQQSIKRFRITLSNRIQMVNKEIHRLEKQLNNYKTEATRQRSNLLAEIEELNLRINDVNKLRDKFETDIVTRVDCRTDKVPVEKVVKFIEIWIKNIADTIEKLRLKTLTIKSQIKKAKKQLLQREELGESLHSIDFQAIAIENEIFSRQISEKHEILIRMKQISGKYNLQLNNLKKDLNDQRTILNNLEEKVTIKTNQIERVETNFQKNKSQLKSVIEKSKISDGIQIPDPMKFIKLDAELREMKKTYQSIARHKNIQKMSLQVFQKRQLGRN